MKNKNTVFSGIAQIPGGMASDTVIQGCMVLEGGAFRGVYTSGVLDALMQEGINMQCTVGVSAGALNGVNYVSGQIGRSARTNLQYRHDKRYVGLGAVRNNGGLIGFDFLFEDLEEIEPLNRTRLSDPSRRFVVVATSCLSGEPVYFETDNCSDIFQAVRASASLPYVSKMVMVDDKPYLDGGCSCKIPYQWALDNGFEKIIVIKTREDAYRKKTAEDSNHALSKTMYRNYPQFAAALARSDADYNAQCDALVQLEQEGRLLVISPSAPVEVSRMESDMEKLGQLYWLGYRDARAQMKRVKAYLEIFDPDVL